jgi:hypothetical protein
MNDMATELELLGDALQQAWRRDHRKRARRLRLLVALALIAVAATAGGAIAAGVLKSASEEERGVLAGHLLFWGTEPHCEARTATSFHCTLAERPTEMTFYDEDGRQLFDVYLGYKLVTVDADHRVDGACVAVAADGRAWDCFLREEAIARGLLHEELLGDRWPDPPPTG